MRLLVTGGSSYLGRHLIPLALPKADVCYTYFQNDPLQHPQGRPLNICDVAAVTHLVQSFHPNVIIHTVGSNRSPNMEAVIRRGARHVVQAAASVQARLIHLSTDSIFRGDAAPYDETAVPTPVNAYGRAKAAAEAIVAGYTQSVIVRTSLIYGLTEMDHGTAWMARALQAGEPVTLFTNQRRNPVWVQTLSLAWKMLDWWNIQPRDTLTFGSSTGDQWPLDCELDLTRATAVLQTPLLGVDDVLASSSPPGTSKT